jgi:glycosyltransferase involved in cell wall biosynthesis
MELGFDSKRLFCNYTGLGNYSRSLLKNLIEFFPDNNYHLYTVKTRLNDQTRAFFDNPGCKIHLPDTILKSFWRSFSIKKQIKSDHIALFHGLSNEIPVGIDRTATKSVVTIHDLIFRHYPETYKPIDRKIYDLKFKYACRHSDRIIAISESTKRDIINCYNIDPEKIEVIYQTCDPLFYSLKDPQENDLITRQYHLPSEYLLSVGSIEPRKNLKSIILSFRHLKKDLQIPLVIIGRGGQYRSEAEQLAKKEGIEKSLILLDSLSNNSHLQSILQNSKALIYPSLYEGFGLPVAEALLCKTPVIASERSSLKEAGGPGSLYIDPESPEQIAGAITQVLTDHALCISMKETGYAFAHQAFAREGQTAKIIECYEEVTSDE